MAPRCRRSLPAARPRASSAAAASACSTRFSRSRAARSRAARCRSIAFAGPVTALATVNCAIGDRYFTDYLNLVLLDGRWQIIAKVFHAEPLAGND